jgi:hypothetical protein
MTEALPHIRTIEQIKADARKAYDEKRLGFQLDLGITGGLCLYRYEDDKGNVVGACGIGATFLDEPMSEELMERIDEMVGEIVAKGILKIVNKAGRADPRLLSVAARIQETHDYLMRSMLGADERAVMLRKFLTLIDHPSVKKA